MATIQTFFALQMLVLAKILDLSQTKHYFIELVSSLAKSGHNRDLAQPCHACQCSVNQGRGRRVPPPPRLFLGAVQRASNERADRPRGKAASSTRMHAVAVASAASCRASTPSPCLAAACRKQRVRADTPATLLCSQHQQVPLRLALNPDSRIM
jgi:hypothetical protein